MADVFRIQSGTQYHGLYLRARLMAILLAAALGVLVFVWASQLYGWPAGVAALFLFTFSPCMLAHGHLVTLDMPGALGCTAAAYALWRCLERPTASRSGVLGAVLGVAVLLKLSGVALIATVPVAVIASATRESATFRPSWARWLALLCVAAVAFLVVLNLGYGGQGTLTSLDHASFNPSGHLAALQARVPWLRVPLPLLFVKGVDSVMTGGKVIDPCYFLAGELSSTAGGIIISWPSP
jgi:4-amino-4-deoxy-L-arabinose transferase-like glycosyltransferase